MPFGGNDWLALTQEPALEPELPICDAHHLDQPSGEALTPAVHSPGRQMQKG